MAADNNTLVFGLRIDLPSFVADLERAFGAVEGFVQRASQFVVRLKVDSDGAQRQAREASKTIRDEASKVGSGAGEVPFAVADPKSRKELEQYIAALRSAQTETAKLGKAGAGDMEVLTQSIVLAEKELAKLQAQEHKGTTSSGSASKGGTSGGGASGGGASGSGASGSGASEAARSAGSLLDAIKEKMSHIGGDIGSALGLDRLAGLIPGAQAGFTSLWSTIGMGNPVLSGVLAAVTMFAAGFHGFLDIGERFHQAFSTIRIETGATGERLHGLENDLKRVYASTSDSSLEKMAADVGNLNATLGLSGPPLQKLTTQMANLEKMGNATSVRSFARFVGDANVPVEKASYYLDKLFVASQQTGVPIERLEQLMVRFGAPMRNFGLSIEESLALLGRFEKEGVNTELVMGSLRIASGKFARAGIDLKTGLAAAVKEIKEAKDTSMATAIAMEKFGARAGADMADTIRNGKFEIEAWLSAMKKSPETIARARRDVASFGGEFTKLKRNVEVAVEPIGTALVDGLRVGAKGISAVLLPILQGIGSVVSATVVPALHLFEGGIEWIGEHSHVFAAMAVAAGILAVAMNAGAIGAGIFAVASGIASAATSAWAVAMGILNAIMALNPAFLIAAGVVALVGVVALFISSTKDLSQATDDAAEARQKFNQVYEDAQATRKSADALDDLASRYDNLKDRTDPEGQREFAAVSAELAQRVPEAADAVDTFGDSGEKAGTKYRVTTAIVRDFAEEQRRMAKEAEADALATMVDNASDLAASLKEDRAEVAQLREEQKKYAAAVDAGHGKFALGMDWHNAETNLKATNAELAEHNAKIAAAYPELNKNIEAFREQGFTVEEIAKTLHVSVDDLQQMHAVTPDFRASLVNSEALKRSISGMSEEQRRAVNQVVTQTEAYQAAQTTVAELNDKLSSAKAIGDTDVAKKLQGELDEAQKTVDDHKLKLRTTLDANQTKEALKSLPADAQSALKPITATVQLINDDKAIADAQQRAGTLISDAATLQQRALAATSEEQKKLYAQQVMDKGAEMSTLLRQQAAYIADTDTKLQTLKAARDKATDPRQQALLNGEIIEMQRRVDDGTKAYARMAVKTKEVGMAKSDVHQLGTEFKFSAVEARGAELATGAVDDQLKVAAADAEAMAEQFRSMGSEAKKTVDADIGALALVAVKRRLNQQVSAQEDAAAKEAAAKIGGDVRVLRAVEETEKKLRDQYAGTTEKKREVRARDHKGELESYEALQKLRLAAVDNELLREVLAAQQVTDLEKARLANEEKNAREKIRADRANGKADEARQAEAELRSAIVNKSEIERLSAERMKLLLAGDVIGAAAMTDPEKGALAKAIKSAGDYGRRLADASQQTFERLVALRQKLAADVLKIDDEANARETEVRRAYAESITESDVASVEARTRMLAEATRREASAKIDGLLAGSSDFQAAAKGATTAEANALLTAQIELATRLEAYNDKRNELLAGGSTEEQVRTATAELLVGLDAQRRVVADAQANLVNTLKGLRQDFAAVFDLSAGADTSKLTARQRQLYAALASMSNDARRALHESITHQVEENAAAAARATTEGERIVREARDKALLASIGDDAERELAQRLIDARKEYEKVAEEVAQGEREIDRIRRQASEERYSIFSTFETEAARATTDAEREAALDRRDVALDALVKQYGDQEEWGRRALELTERLENAKTALAAKTFAVEEESRTRTDKLYASSTAFIRGLFDELYKGVDEARRQQLAHELEDIYKQRHQLLEDIKARKIALRDYVSSTSDLLKQQQEKEQALGIDAGNFWANLYRGTLSGLKALGQSYADQGAAALKRLSESASASLKLLPESGRSFSGSLKALFNGSEDSIRQLGTVAAGTFGNIAMEFAKLAESGKASLGDFANVAILQVLKTTQAAVSAFIPQIMAAFSALGPWGIPAGIAAIATVEGLLAVAQSKVQGSLAKKGFFVGGYTGDGSPHDEAGVVHRREFVLTAGITDKHRGFLERLHAGEDPLNAAIAHYTPAITPVLSNELSIAPDGTLAGWNTWLDALQSAAVDGLARLASSVPAVDVPRLSTLAALPAMIPVVRAGSLSGSSRREPDAAALHIADSVMDNAEVITDNLGRRLDVINDSVGDVATEVARLRRVRTPSRHAWLSR